jgi:hypothetical protein
MLKIVFKAAGQAATGGIKFIRWELAFCFYRGTYKRTSKLFQNPIGSADRLYYFFLIT